MRIFDGRSLTALERAQSAATLKHQAIAENLANVDTPGYKRAEVRFDDILKAAQDRSATKLAVTNPRHIQQAGGATPDAIVRETGTAGRVDGNNVDIDREMAELARNTLYFDTVTTLIGRKLSGLKSVINEGKK